MANVKCSRSQNRARNALAAVVVVVMSSAASAAVQMGDSSSVPTLPPGYTVYHGPVFAWPIDWPVFDGPIIVGPILPSPISKAPAQPAPIVSNPTLARFPTFAPPPFGPIWNPKVATPAPTMPVQSPIVAPTTSTPADVAAVVAGDNQFAYDLYGTLSNTNTGNMVFSPYSISTALAMTYAGAAGQTATEMANTLHFTLPQNQLHPAMGQLINQINSQGGANYQLNVANHLWGQTGFPFLSSFINTTSADYQAPLTQLDFKNSPEPSRQTINTWTANQTNQKIQNLLPAGSVTPDTRLVLSNAVYFKGQWASAFQASLTQQETFHLSSGSMQSVQMMHQGGSFKYGAFQNFSMLDLPYQGGDISMVAILPSQSSSLASVEKSLNVQMLNQDESQLSSTLVNVGLPKFTMTSQFDLPKTLAGTGMVSAFSPSSANFSGMDGNRDLFISDVIHKAYVSVDERGTEATGATAVVVGACCQSAPEPPEDAAVFDADRPFDFLIRDDKSGSILFMGRVSDPGGTPIVTPLPEDSFFSSPQDGTLSVLPEDTGSGGTFVTPGSLYPSELDTQRAPSHATLDISPVPEPSTWAMLIAASIALATIARRRGK